MEWRLYRIRFQLLSGLHAGSLPVGNILKTQRYVTGKILWGAVTSGVVERGGDRPEPRKYEAAGRKIAEVLRFGCFFPFAPAGADDTLIEITDAASDEFEYAFLDTYSSTAIHNKAGRAEDASLHEIEMIRPMTRQSTKRPSKPVHLAGYVAVAHSELALCGAEDVSFCGVSVRSVLEKAQLGGKRGYGFGKVRLLDFALATDILGASFRGDGTVALPAGVAAAAQVAGRADLKVKAGTLEPVVGREWKETSGFGAGQHISDAKACYAPGSVYSESCSFTIGPFGIWN